jgi:mannose-6-phosphate isomerase-like protein (cupin superfamily)
MMPAAINFAEQLARIDAPWSPRVVAEPNDGIPLNRMFKLVKIQGDFVRHRHDDTDEAFLVQSGELHIEFRDTTHTLGADEILLVPRVVEHRPHAQAECHVLPIEPRGMVDTGDAGGAMTATDDVWI